MAWEPHAQCKGTTTPSDSASIQCEAPRAEGVLAPGSASRAVLPSRPSLSDASTGRALTCPAEWVTIFRGPGWPGWGGRGRGGDNDGERYPTPRACAFSTGRSTVQVVTSSRSRPVGGHPEGLLEWLLARPVGGTAGRTRPPWPQGLREPLPPER